MTMKDTPTLSEHASPTGELEINVTLFKARCLELLKALETNKLKTIKITRRGKPLAELKASGNTVASLWGAHRGSVQIADGVDLTAPVLDEEFDAERGILHR